MFWKLKAIYEMYKSVLYDCETGTGLLILICLFPFIVMFYLIILNEDEKNHISDNYVERQNYYNRDGH